MLRDEATNIDNELRELADNIARLNCEIEQLKYELASHERRQYEAEQRRNELERSIADFRMELLNSERERLLDDE